MAQYANPQQFGAPMGDNDGGYMEQDEEWEREGLLDPAWEKQQRKVRDSPNHNKIKSMNISWSFPKSLQFGLNQIQRIDMKNSALSTYEEQKSFLKLSYLTF